MTWHDKRNIKKIKQWMNNKKITNEKNERNTRTN